MADDVHVLERGDAAFLYRPKVDEEQVGAREDVQRLFVVLRPSGGGPVRRIAVGRGELPPEGWAGRRHGWGFVDLVTDDPAEVGRDGAGGRYETKTRGERVQPPDRAAGEGPYALVRHGDHVHLVHELRLPEAPGEAQEELNLLDRDLVVSVKDPRTAGRGGGPTAPGPAAFGADLLDRFSRGETFRPVDPPAYLDHVNAEVLLIPATDDDRVRVELDAPGGLVEALGLDGPAPGWA